ncbi:disease resistance protein RGA5 [Lolium perenne]|uniref:disease resistance protein RGA5 n=1 Tax=Lolium perenne TaxID=4522 RepID=UPI0021F61A99|nr:disease resistance protein RGA5-like [Lolium perenne]
MAVGLMVSVSTGAMNSLLGKLTTLMGEEFARLKNLRKQVKFIQDELIGMKDALEELLFLNELDTQTKRWRDIVRDMSYDIEDIIDDFMQNIGENNKSTGFVSNTVRRLKTSRARHRIAGQIEDIKKLVIETSLRRERYKLDIPPQRNVFIDPRVATLYENADNLVGVEGPATEYVNWLNDEEKQLKVLSIVGFGGLGKTTLANEVYRRLKGVFEGSAFVSVSQKPNAQKLLGNLLSQLGTEPSVHDCESHLLDKLREHLQAKRYLIIIYDIWDVHAWAVLKCAFPENDLGSRIITTTRIQEVARACCFHQHGHILEMKPLSNEDSRRLFYNRIFGSQVACPHHLEDVSVEILEKCGGLPLAIISISSMLASSGSNQKERWKDVLDSLGSGTNLTLDGIRKILNLSYKDLLPHLKTCLLYIGMYPEDYTIDRSNLELQWIAEGFVSRANGQDMEKVARNYFNELVNRSLIQPVAFDMQGSVTQCKVHDMMLDLILLKSAEENFLTILDGSQIFTRSEYKVRRLSIRLNEASIGGTILPRNISMSQVRSVMYFGSSENQNTPPLSMFKFLRVLFIDLDEPIVDFTGLFVQSVHTSYQHRLERSNIWKHLFCPTLLPDGIGNMKSLRHLGYFDFERNTLDNIRDLGQLTNLRYLALACGHLPHDRERRMDALCSSLGKLCSLEDLLVNVTHSSNVCIEGLKILSPPTTTYRLERLFMPNPHFFRVPSWMRVLRNLGHLECRVNELLKDGVGILSELPFLANLNLMIQNVTNEMIVIYGKGGFPALKRFELRLSSASYLAFEEGAIPMLRRLKLVFNASGTGQSGDTPAGIEHLLALEELLAEIGCANAEESDMTSIESALRSAINMHPSNPRVGIDFKNYNLTFVE